MGLLSLAAAAGVGYAAAKVVERAKVKNVNEKPTPEDYVNEAKELAGELIDKGIEKAPEVLEKAGDLTSKAKEKIDEYIENSKKE